MRGVLIVGGGVAGCSAAAILAQSHIPVYIVDKSKNIGGRAINYGCKATDTCLKCNLCLAQDVWQSIVHNPYIEVITGAKVAFCSGDIGNFSIKLKLDDGRERELNPAAIIVATGFKPYDLKNKGYLGYGLYKNVLSGLDVEEQLSYRTSDALPFIAPSVKKLAFLQCIGSRDVQDKAPYCSKVCCAYALRMGQTIHHYYPHIEITYFYMDIQEVGGVFSDYYSKLIDNGFKFILSRPVTIEQDKDGHLNVIYENLATATVISEPFDMVVLSQGIRPIDDTREIADTFGLGFDVNGFLKEVLPGAKSGIYVAGTAKGPMNIADAITDARRVALKLMLEQPFATTREGV